MQVKIKKNYFKKLNVKSHYNNAFELTEQIASVYKRVVSNT